VARVDRLTGIGLVLFAIAIFGSALTFPDVPGQKIGAGFLPMLIGVGLGVCGLGLIRRSLRASARGTGPAASVGAPSAKEHYGSAAVIVAAIAGYIVFSDWLGFLIVAPVCLFAVFTAFRLNPAAAIGWSIGATLIVHLVFYKLLKVPLPWGLLRPWY